MARDNKPPYDGFPVVDVDWGDEHWRELLERLTASGIVTWREIGSLVLGHINPPQIGTSLASNSNFQRRFPRRKTWEAVRKWGFDQTGQCATCGTRLELQADHIVPKELIEAVGALFGRVDASVLASEQALLEGQVDIALDTAIAAARYDAVPGALRDLLRNDLLTSLAAGHRGKQLHAVADRLENLTFRCRRCNVIRRPSHALGGRTFLTAEAALMWLLFTKQPGTYQEFAELCREYGLSMADIRFQEAWAMAKWLARVGLYAIQPGSKH